MSHTTQLRGGWIAISDGYKLNDESQITLKHTYMKQEYNLQYSVIRDFFAQQIGYELESIFEDVDAASIIDRLVEANRKPMEFWPGSNLPKDETYSLEPVEDGTTLKEILAVLEDIHSTLCEPDV